MGPLAENTASLLLVSAPQTGLRFPQACASQENSREPVGAEGSSVFVSPMSVILGVWSQCHAQPCGSGRRTGRKVKGVTRVLRIK